MNAHPRVVGAAWFPGSMRAIAPVIRALQGRGWAAEMLASDSARPVAARFGLDGVESPVDDGFGAAEIRAFLERPISLVVTGVGEGIPAELNWLAAVRRAGIPSLGVLDTWGDYGRLTRASVAAGEYPDVLAVMNEQARRDVDAACSWPRVVAVGHPGLEEFLADDLTDIYASARRSLDLDASQDRVSFFSQPIEQLFGNSIGYTQYDALRALKTALTATTSLVVAAHPRDDADALREAAGMDAVVLEQYDPVGLYSASNLVVSCFSACLVEAALALKPTLSVQPSLRGQNRCWAASLGVAETALTASEIPAAIERARCLGRDRRELLRRRALIGVEPGSIERVITLAEELLGKRLSPA